MKLQKILNRFQKLHKREIDLSLDRIKALCQKLGSPEDKMRVISVVGTNAKFSTVAGMFSILKEANMDFSNIIKLNILLDNLENFEKVNQIMSRLFEEPYPARAAYEVSKLPKNSSVEIETIAYQGSEK